MPGAVRIHHLCQAACHCFTSVHALTTANRRFFQQDSTLILPAVPVTEVPAWDLRRLSIRKNAVDTQTFVSGTVKNSFWGRRLRQLVDSFPFNILISDGGLIYILKGYQAGKRLVHNNGITHLFSTFRPYSDHVIAWLLKKRFPHLVWVADFRDLHLDEKHGRQLYWWPLQRWFNQKILSRADLVTTVSAGLATKLSAFSPAVKLLRNGIPAAVGSSTAITHAFFTIVYTGRIYPGEQTALLLFTILQELIQNGQMQREHLRLCYAGPTPEYWSVWAAETALTDLLDIQGLVSMEQARSLQRQSAVNLLLAYSSAGQKGDLSSKIYEYLASGNAILAIINGEKDPEFEAFFSSLEPGLLAYHDPADRSRIEKFILERYRAWQEKIPEIWPKNQEMAHSYRTEVLFANFFTQELGLQPQPK